MKVLVTIMQISQQGDQKLMTANLLQAIYENLSVSCIIFLKRNTQFPEIESKTLTQ
jgi:hypothetical protein